MNAALPHGGGSDRTLHISDFITFDVGGTLHGYWSDVTRTFALDDSEIPPKHLRYWNIVRDAQAAALEAAKVGVVAEEVDAAARSVIGEHELGQYFTHRLGHGLYSSSSFTRRIVDGLRSQVLDSRFTSRPTSEADRKPGSK